MFQQQILLFFLTFYCSASSTYGFFFKAATTAAPTTVHPYANKPIIIHHHHKWKYVYPTTTAAPIAWHWPAPTEAPHPWHNPTWGFKPVVELPQEVPPSNPWKPSVWQWQPTTTTAAPTWVLPATELPQKWAYKRESHLNENDTFIKPTNNSQHLRIIKPEYATTTESPKTSIITSVSPKLKTKILIRRANLIANPTSMISPRVENVNNSDNSGYIERAKKLEEPIDEVDIKWPSQSVQSETEAIPAETPEPNILYKYIYKVHSPITKDIKMHQEQSDGSQIIGHYSLVEPDGTTRVVYYTADENGFNADVKHFDWSLKSKNEADKRKIDVSSHPNN